MRFVLDNSVAMRWLFRDGTPEAVAYADLILDRLAEEGALALVPCVWALEVANVIARAEARGLLQEARSAEFLGILHDMAIEADARSDRQAPRRHAATRAPLRTLQLRCRLFGAGLA